MELRDGVIVDPSIKKRFDDHYEPVIKALDKARETAREIRTLVNDHEKALKQPGAVVGGPGDGLIVNIAVNPILDRRFDSFTVFAYRALKLTQYLVKDVSGLDIGFLFRSEANYAKGLSVMRSSKPELADYLDAVRQQFADPLARLRNDIEHKGWNMPGMHYRMHEDQLQVGKVQIQGLSFTSYVDHVVIGTIRFVEDMTTYALKTILPAPRAVIELPEVQRASGNPKRFAFGVQGDYRTWRLSWATDSTDFLWDGQ
jgi:hypothetical protein